MIKALIWSLIVVGIGAGGGWLYAQVAPPVFEVNLAVPTTNGAGGKGASASAAAALMSQNAIIQSAAALSGMKLNGNRSVKVEPSPDNTFVKISVFGRKPEQIANMANDLVATYKSETVKTNESLQNQATEQLLAQRSTAAHNLRSVEAKIAQVEKETGILDIGQRVQHVANYQETLEQQKDLSNTQLQGLLSQIKNEKKLLASLPKTTQTEVVKGPNPVLQGYEDQLQALQAKRITLLQTWLETSSTVQAVEAQITAVKKLMTDARAPQLSVQTSQTSINPQHAAIARQLASDESDAANLQATLNAIQSVSEQQAVNAKSLPVAQSEMVDLVRKKKLAETNFENLANQLVAVQNGTFEGKAPELGPYLLATAPTTSIWPDASVTTEYGAGIGLVFGILTFIGLVPRSRISDAGDTAISSNALNAGSDSLSLMSRTSAPALPGKRNEGLATLALPSGSPAETYRFLVFSLQARAEECPRTVLFTGVSSDAACSEAAAQFAIAMSQTGVKTLLADCNLRHKSLTDAFGFLGKSGVSDVLGKTMLPVPGSDLMLETTHSDLYFLPCGTEESDGLASYQNLQVYGFIEEFDSRAEVKVINSSPCTVVADAPRLVRYVDEVFLVATPSEEAKGLVDKAMRILNLAGAKKLDLLIVDSKGSQKSFLG